MNKRYDRDYFQRWYRGTTRVTPPAQVRRKVAIAVAMTEYFLQRRLRTVLDVGCGEGAWLPQLRSIRPGLAYQGVDPSAYAVKRFGRARNIRRGTFGELAALQLDPQFDLVVCSDVLHYLEPEDIHRGIAEIARLCRGVAFLEVLTREDDVVGDLEGLMQRPAAWYRGVFRTAGLTQAGPYTWLSGALRDDVTDLESFRR
jgi:SAM-dependent methyltransferase